MFLVWWRRALKEGRRFWRVLAITLVAAVLGATAGFVQARTAPPFYQVQVTVAFFPTHYRWNLSSGIVSLNRTRNDIRAQAMVMATGINVLNEVIERMGDTLPEEMRNPQDLSPHLIIRGGQGLYLYLTVKASDPDLARELASTWAAVLKEHTERLFLRYDYDIPLLQQPLEGAEAQLAEAEAALEEFRRQTGIGLVDESRVAIIVSDRAGLRPGIAGFSSRTMELGDTNGQLASYRHAQTMLRSLAEQVRERKAEGRSLEGVPFELVVDLEPVARRGRLTLADLRALGDDYDAVIAALESEANALQPAIDLLASDADRLQGALSADITRLRTLLRQRNTVEDLYNSLVRKQNELKAEAVVSDTYVQIVDVKDVAQARLGQLLRQTVAGGILGGLLGFLLAITWYFVLRPTA